MPIVKIGATRTTTATLASLAVETTIGPYPTEGMTLARVEFIINASPSAGSEIKIQGFGLTGTNTTTTADYRTLLAGSAPHTGTWAFQDQSIWTAAATAAVSRTTYWAIPISFSIGLGGPLMPLTKQIFFLLNDGTVAYTGASTYTINVDLYNIT